MKTRSRILAAVTALATATALVPAASAQNLPAPFHEIDIAASIPFQLPGTAPAPAPAPSFAAPTPDSVEGRLLSATDRHLADMGHTVDGQAWDIAAQWAGQALTGQVEFISGVGRGVTHTEIGDGNIYRLTAAEAEERIQWLDREANTSPESLRYGVASARDGDTVYLVEYFLY